MAEAHQADAIDLVLHLVDVLPHIVDGADLLQHLECGFVGAAMRRTPETGDAGRDACERVGA